MRQTNSNAKNNQILFFFNRDEIKKWSFLFKKMSVILSFGHN